MHKSDKESKNELRKDPVTGRWTIITMSGKLGPEDFPTENHRDAHKFCPFCYGNESKTPPEITAHRENGTAPDTPGWKVRVIPNKFPALQIEGNLDKEGAGVFDVMNGIGAHEVIIETPGHDLAVPDLPEDHLQLVISTYKERMLDLSKDRRFKYMLIFKNYGASAGASLSHPHSQLIALPVVPKRVRDELNGASQYYQYKDRCVFCDMISQELKDKRRLVMESDDFVSFTPFASRFPFETWLIPRRHSASFAHDPGTQSLAKMLKTCLASLREVLKDPSYNFIIHTSPVEAAEAEGYHWHIEIMPKLTRIAGFEWGTGFYINPTPPEDAADCLRNACK